MKRRIGIAWPLNPLTGWGVYGVNLVLEMLRTPDYEPIPLYAPRAASVFDPRHHARIAPLFGNLRPLHEKVATLGDRSIRFDFPVLHSLGNNLLRLSAENVTGSRNLGVIFSEDSRFNADGRARAKRYEVIIAGSTWNADALKRSGIEGVRIVFQGIDPELFHPSPSLSSPAIGGGKEERRFPDRFVLFSGGKLEYRKGQDIIVEAFRHFHARHPDALLVTAWHTFFPDKMVGIERAGHVRGVPRMDEAANRLQIGDWLRANGLPEGSFLDADVQPNYWMAQLLREADAALFTNRCEAGTNLVAMECMACGVPVILSANTGHLDLIREDNCFPLRTQGRVKPSPQFVGVEDWGESDIGEVVETLETVYVHREEARKRGLAAAEFLRDWTWEKQVRRLLETLADIV